MTTSVRQTGSFKAESATGQEFTILEFTKYEETRAADGTVTWTERGIRLATAYRAHVVRLAKGAYAIVTAAGTILARSSDPAAR